MRRRSVVTILIAALLLLLTPGIAVADPAADRGRPEFEPGAAGVGDPYFPLDGNGGYDVRHYLLDMKYDPETDVLSGVATIRAHATQNLSSFNLDFAGLTVNSVTVNDRRADWTRDGDEMTVTPRRGLPEGSRFTTVVTYEGIPEMLPDNSGFIHTDDGAIVVGQPHVADTWYPVNDHPIDKASYTIKITVPTGLEAISNGVLERQRERGRWTTWMWDAREPMASYLSMMAIGEFDVRAYSEAGIRYLDALDPDLSTPFAPRTGDQFALSQMSQPAYKRLARTISVPAEGAELSFWIHRDTEAAWDFVFVEAHTVGQDDWTTLPDENGNTSQDTGFACPFWLGLHPFLEHYQTDLGNDTCAPTGTTGGEWHAASGSSNGYEQWAIDLSRYAGSEVEVSITYASDDFLALPGVFVDDIEVSTGEGSTSFEDDGDVFDGWTVPGAPEGSAENPDDWIVGTAADAPATLGEVAEASLARQPEIVDFLSDVFGRYPFSAAGGVVDDVDALGFALETQTRPIYSKLFFTDQISGDAVVVHELAHQWFGDSLTIELWQHIWLNEGFASYAEWLWSEREGLGKAQEIFDSFYDGIPADDPFWTVTIGGPGVDDLFDIAVYNRGAMTLHALRVTVGDDDFFRILRRWAQSQEGGHVNTDEFIALAERISGQQLDDLFQAWLFTPAKPAPPGMEADGAAAAAVRSETTSAGVSGGTARLRR